MYRHQELLKINTSLLILDYMIGFTILTHKTISKCKNNHLTDLVLNSIKKQWITLLSWQLKPGRVKGEIWRSDPSPLITFFILSLTFF